VNTPLECPSCRQSDGVVNVQAAYDNEASRISKDDYVLPMTHIGVAPTMMPRESAVPALSRKLNPRDRTRNQAPPTSQVHLTHIIHRAMRGIANQGSCLIMHVTAGITALLPSGHSISLGMTLASKLECRPPTVSLWFWKEANPQPVGLARDCIFSR
jgi:hypothetical protein